jgi:hypothetical protein
MLILSTMSSGKIKSLLKWILILQFFPIFVLAQAPITIPTTSGFGGFFIVAPGAFNAQTNVIANGPPFFRYAGYKKIESIFSSPVSKSAIGPAFTTEINYTFAKSKTQLFFGNRMEDLLHLDVPFGLGVRQELKDSSILSFSVLLTPLFLNYWEDSFVENEDRVITHVNFPGVRLIWDRIFKTGLELSTTYRLFKLGEEKNGQWLVDRGELDPDLQHLLVREGNVFRLQALYRLKINRHRLEPNVRYVDENFDGAAMATKGYVLRVNYIYPTPKVIFEATLNYGNRKAKAMNPIYNETLDAVRYGTAVAGVVPVKMGNSRRWSIVIAAEYLAENANINFFDSKLASILVGLQYRNMRR